MIQILCVFLVLDMNGTQYYTQTFTGFENIQQCELFRREMNPVIDIALDRGVILQGRCTEERGS